MAGASEFFDLAADFGKASAGVASAAYTAFKAEGEQFAEDWRANAEATSGEHGRKYPPTIDSETKLAVGIYVETGPNPALGSPARAGRGYEFGSENQPPHLDGARALPAAEARLEKTAAETIRRVLP